MVFGQVAEESLDRVEPAAGGRREVEMKSRMPCGPGEHVGVFVCGVVVDDEMKLLVFRGLAVDQTQELESLLMAVAIHAGGHQLAIERIQRRKQCGCAVTLVVVSHGLSAAFFHGQAWLGSIQRLNLALLVQR